MAFEIIEQDIGFMNPRKLHELRGRRKDPLATLDQQSSNRVIAHVSLHIG
jgi:hypothetical protein